MARRPAEPAPVEEEFDGESADTMAAAAPKPSVGAGGALAALFASLDQAKIEADAELEAAEARLAEARRNHAAVSALLRIKEGGELPLLGGGSSGRSGSGRMLSTPRQSSGGGKPRGEAGRMIAQLLAAHRDGLKAGEIIDSLKSTGIEEVSIRNALASGKRSGSIGYDESRKVYLPVS